MNISNSSNATPNNMVTSMDKPHGGNIIFAIELIETYGESTWRKLIRAKTKKWAFKK